MTRKKTAFTGIEVIIVLAVIAIGVALSLSALQRSFQAQRLEQCQNVLRQWGQAMALYASESPGNLYPPMHVVKKNHAAYPVGEDCLQMLFAPQFDAMFPEYLADAKMIQCPSNLETGAARGNIFHLPDADDGYGCHMSYCYAGWVFDRLNTEPAQQTNAFPHIIEASFTLPDQPFPSTYFNAQFATGMEAYLAAVNAAKEKELPGLRFLEIADGPLPAGALGNHGGDTLHRLATGIERFLTSDVNNNAAAAEALSKIWVMMDVFAATDMYSAFNHIPGGANVLYLDGAVRFVPYIGGMLGPDMDRDGEAPVLPGVGGVLSALY